MFRKCLALAAGMMTVASMARAADLAPILKAPPAVFVAGWTGPYVGAHGGGGWDKSTWIDNFPTPDGVLDADPKGKGWLGGFQGGYNYQFYNWVVGVQGDFGWSDINASFSCFSFGGQICSGQTQWIAMLTGRVGAIFGPSLIYLKGGPAWSHNEYTNLATSAAHSGGVPALPGELFSASETRNGWIVGGGVEYRISPNWSLMAEYNYLDFGKRSVPFTGDSGGFFTEEIQQHINVVKVGVNYFFLPAAAITSSGYGWRPLNAAAASDDAPGTVNAFTAFDVSRQSVEAWAGGLIALSRDSDTSGWRVYMLGGGGSLRYPAGDIKIRDDYAYGDVLGGYGFEGDTYSINLLAGANFSNHVLSEPDPTNAVQGTKAGAKVRADAYLSPTDRLMAYTEIEYSTAFRTFLTGGKIGYDFFGKDVYIGPETSYSSDEESNQFRIGGHISNLKLGRISIDLSGGYSNDSIIGKGAYARIETNTNF